VNQWDYGRHDPYGGAGASGPDDDDGTAAYPITWEREPFPPGSVGFSGHPLDDATRRLGLPVTSGRTRPGREGGDWPDEDWPPRHRRAGGVRTRWLLPALIVIAGASAAAGLILTSGHPAAPPSAARPAPPRPVPPASTPPMAAAGPLTMTQAAQVLAGYTSANNTANAQRSDTELAAIETGSSYAVDAGIYRTQQAESAAPYPAFGPQKAQYYIPSETSYPRWFVVLVTNADLASPTKTTGMEYLLFTQAAPGAAWKNTVEPYVITGAAPPAVALGAGGLATPVTGTQGTGTQGTGTTASLAVPAGQIAQVTASSLDGDGPLPNPGNLADLMDQKFWHDKLPASSVTDAHAPDAGTGVFGLRTTDGGALLFYTDTAELTLTAPAGEAMHLTIPGYYSPGQALTRAGVGYLEQFATYDPPAGSSGPRVVADYSGITSAA
jgi:hypothetical protein